MTKEKNKIKDIIANISKKKEWSDKDTLELIKEKNFNKLKNVRDKLAKLYENQSDDKREESKKVIKFIDESINIIISTRIRARRSISEGMRNFVSYKFETYDEMQKIEQFEKQSKLVGNKEDISNTKTEETRMNQKDTFELLKSLTDSDYKPTPNEIEWIKEQTFKTYRSQWPKFKEMKEPFPSILNELKTNAIPLSEFYKLLDNPTDHFKITLLHSFLHEVNKNPNSTLYKRTPGMEVIVRGKIPPNQTKPVPHIWLIKKK